MKIVSLGVARERFVRLRRVAKSGDHAGRPELVSMPQRGEDFQAHVAARCGSLVVLFEEARADQTDETLSHHHRGHQLEQ